MCACACVYVLFSSHFLDASLHLPVMCRAHQPGWVTQHTTEEPNRGVRQKKNLRPIRDISTTGHNFTKRAQKKIQLYEIGDNTVPTWKNNEVGWRLRGCLPRYRTGKSLACCVLPRVCGRQHDFITTKVYATRGGNGKPAPFFISSTGIVISGCLFTYLRGAGYY